MDTRTNVLSLCSGVGGLDLGVRLAVPSARTVCYVEIDAHCCEVLASQMENGSLDAAPIWTDLRTFDGREWRGVVDLIIGGYPCQPFSVAGKRGGVNDPRHLWPHIARIIREVQPVSCFFENVAGHLSLGFDTVVNESQEMGFELAAGLFTAEEVGTPHKRERLFIMGYSASNDKRWNRRSSAGRKSTIGGSNGHMADPIWNGECRPERETGSRWGVREAGRELAVVGDADSQGPQGWMLRDSECQDERAIGTSGNALADTERVPDERWRDGGKLSIQSGEIEGVEEERKRCRYPIDDPRGIVADPSLINEREPNDETSTESRGEPREGSGQRSYPLYVGEFSLPPYPPPPTDLDAWAAILSRFPELAPAIAKGTTAESSICRMADGMADRVDRLRAGGNGVVPQQAEFAYRTLRSAFEV